MILFYNGFTIKDESNQNVIFCHILNDIGFPVKGKLLKINVRFGVYAFQYPPLCSFSSTDAC
jgi:hypothetical protein